MYVLDLGPVFQLLDAALSSGVAGSRQRYSSNDDGVEREAASPACPLGHPVVLKCRACGGQQQPSQRWSCFGSWDDTVVHRCCGQKGGIEIL